MKNIPSLAGALLLVCGATSTVSAQLGIGLRAGPLVSKESFDPDNTVNEIVSEDNLTGFTVGVPIEIALNPIITLQPEINYQFKRSSFVNRFDYQGARATQEFERKLHNLEIPLLLKLGYTTESFTLAGLVGPSFGYAFSGSQTYSDYLDATGTALGKTTPGEGDLVFSGTTRDRVEWSGVLGGQFGLPALGGKMILDGRYMFGLNELKDGGDVSVNDNVSNIKDSFTSKSQGFSITLGYMLTLGDY